MFQLASMYSRPVQYQRHMPCSGSEAARVSCQLLVLGSVEAGGSLVAELVTFGHFGAI